MKNKSKRSKRAFPDRNPMVGLFRRFLALEDEFLRRYTQIKHPNQPLTDVEEVCNKLEFFMDTAIGSWEKAVFENALQEQQPLTPEVLAARIAAEHKADTK